MCTLSSWESITRYPLYFIFIFINLGFINAVVVLVCFLWFYKLLSRVEMLRLITHLAALLLTL